MADTFADRVLFLITSILKAHRTTQYFQGASKIITVQNSDHRSTEYRRIFVCIQCKLLKSLR
jgi:hypothetical protein